MTTTAVVPDGGPERSQRPPAEVRHAAELTALRAANEDPPGRQLSLRAARRFVVGDEQAGISRKFVGNTSPVPAPMLRGMTEGRARSAG